MDVDLSLVQAVKERLSTLDHEQIREAIQLTENFPQPGPEPADIAAQVLHDVALHAEMLADWPLVVSLYHRSLAYTTISRKIPLGSWFRCGVCYERMADYRNAIRCYEKAIELEEAWPYVASLARKNLASLLLSGEVYEPAAALLETLFRALPHPEIRRDEILADLAHCLCCIGETSRAKLLLEESSPDLTDSEASLRCLQILAEIYEENGQTESAISCYERMIHHSAAPTNIKAAAAYRREALKKRK